eukprot:Colp12_sorted_trinity150504_noHs@11269
MSEQTMIEFKFLGRANSLPYVGRGVEAVKKAYTYVKTSTTLTETHLTRVEAITTDLLTSICKHYSEPLQKVDSIACAQLDALEARLPAVEATVKRIADTKDAAKQMLTAQQQRIRPYTDIVARGSAQALEKIQTLKSTTASVSARARETVAYVRLQTVSLITTVLAAAMILSRNMVYKVVDEDKRERLNKLIAQAVSESVKIADHYRVYLPQPLQTKFVELFLTNTETAKVVKEEPAVDAKAEAEDDGEIVYATAAE